MGLVQLPEFRMSSDEQLVPLRYEHVARMRLADDNKEYMEYIPNYIDYIWDNSEDGWSWAGIGRGKVVIAFWHSTHLAWSGRDVACSQRGHWQSCDITCAWRKGRNRYRFARLWGQKATNLRKSRK